MEDVHVLKLFKIVKSNIHANNWCNIGVILV